MVEFGCGARCAIRDTGAPGGDCYHWIVTVSGETDPVAAGRTGELGEARSLGILAYVEGGEPSSRGKGVIATDHWQGSSESVQTRDDREKPGGQSSSSSSAFASFRSGVSKPSVNQP
jgi:hypothetical protein